MSQREISCVTHSSTSATAAPNGEQILSRQSLKAMRLTLGRAERWVELTGMGVTLMLRPSAENMTIVEHGGWKEQRSGFVMVPDRNAMTVLTNSDGFHTISDLFASDWALQGRRAQQSSGHAATP